MKKRPGGRAIYFPAHLFWLIAYAVVYVRNARRSLTSGASRPSERGGVISPSGHFLPTPRSRIFLCRIA